MTVLRTKRRRVRNVRPDVLRAIHDDLLTGASAKQVHAALKERYERGELSAGAEIPSERTIVNIARDIQRDDSPAWRIENAQPAEVWPVLDTFLEVYQRSAGRVTSLTETEARLVANVRAANPKLGPWQAFSWARWYLGRLNRGMPIWVDLHDLAIDGREARETPEEFRQREGRARLAADMEYRPGMVDPVVKEDQT
jgi:head-tail adaptor